MSAPVRRIDGPTIPLPAGVGTDCPNGHGEWYWAIEATGRTGFEIGAVRRGGRLVLPHPFLIVWRCEECGENGRSQWPDPDFPEEAQR